MTCRDFAYWLQGFFELSKADPNAYTGITFEQRELIQRHLALVFAHDIDPKAGGPDVQKSLNAIHGPATLPFDKNILPRC